MQVRGLLMAIMLSFIHFAQAKNVCAVVKIRIEQELTLERQGFDAELILQNDLDAPLEKVKVNVHFKDSEGNDVLGSSNANDSKAMFYIRLNDMTGIEDVSGSGVILGGSEANVHWLIIPSPGAAKDNVEGEIYFVGATLTYTQAGKQKEMEIMADDITVKPTPNLSLDYFITKDVYADNPLTKEVKEKAEPFKLGVLVNNSGLVAANNVKIQSAQPEIIEDEQDLLIDFKIIGSKVNGQSANTGLLVDMGIVPPGGVASGYWIMKTTLAGTFKDIDASVSHAENLGGQLTAIIKEDAISTHLLAGMVLNTQQGKDGLPDFLADDGEVGEPAYKLYETDGEISVVKDLSEKASLSFSRKEGNYLYYRLSLPAYDGLFYVDIPSQTQKGYPVSQAKSISTDQRLPGENAWTQYVRENGGTDNAEFVNHLRLFGIKSDGEYEVALSINSREPQAPEFLFDNNSDGVISAKVGQSLSYEIKILDANNDEVALNMLNKLDGVTLTLVKREEGMSVFRLDWTPKKAGKFTLSLEAFDENFKTEQDLTIKVEDLDGNNGDSYLDKSVFFDGFEGK